MTRPFSRVIDAVAALATNLGATVESKGDRLADSLEAISNVSFATGASLPAAPTTNGAYVLTATVSASGVVYSWESTT